MMNIVNRLPVPVYPIDRDRADYAVSKNKLRDYFVRNPEMFRLAMDAAQTEQAVKMAAHACGLWFSRWENPESGKAVIVVASKEVMPFRKMFQQALQSEAVQAALKRHSG